MRDQLAGKLPVTLITGFLGSGKTTLLSKLVRHPLMNKVAVIINEIGEIGIDHDLVTQSTENISLLANGCICCSVRTDMQETLRDLFARRQVGEVFDFDRVVIETTGLADPAPIIQTLTSDTLLEARFRLDGVVTLVDTVNANNLLDTQLESVRQIALADRLLLTKCDLSDEGSIVSLEKRLRTLNPMASFIRVLNGEIAPSDLINIGLSSNKVQSTSNKFLTNLVELQDDNQQDRYLGDFSEKHISIKTLSLTFKEPFTWPAFSSALELLTTLRGPDLLRVKGILNVQGRPVVIQGVQHIFHKPVELDSWPSENHSTRIVFITRNNISIEMIKNLFSAVGAITQAEI
jgi:G3E family GTPase